MSFMLLKKFFPFTSSSAKNQELEAQIKALEEKLKESEEERQKETEEHKEKLAKLTDQHEEQDFLLQMKAEHLSAENERLKEFKNAAQDVQMLLDANEKLEEENDALKESLETSTRLADYYFINLKKSQKEHAVAEQKYRELLLRLQEGGAAPPTCEICEQELTEDAPRAPRTLECGHTTCEECLKKLCNDQGLSCPFCRQKTDVQGPVDVGKLKKNYAVVTIIRNQRNMGLFKKFSFFRSQPKSARKDELKAMVEMLEFQLKQEEEKLISDAQMFEKKLSVATEKNQKTIAWLEVADDQEIKELTEKNDGLREKIKDLKKRMSNSEQEVEEFGVLRENFEKMSTRLEERLDCLKCPICIDDFKRNGPKRPMVMCCGHTACQACLWMCWEAIPEDVDTSCPICRDPANLDELRVNRDLEDRFAVERAQGERLRRHLHDTRKEADDLETENRRLKKLVLARDQAARIIWDRLNKSDHLLQQNLEISRRRNDRIKNLEQKLAELQQKYQELHKRKG
ncbi:unnamed protein product [Caenorhabditis sp. 36 PRJEB53466]|nr:unnamed protein product [Caenorhabditis sp. 36 PRJEB53466]